MLTETISKTDGTSTTINYGWDANGNLLSKKSSDQTIDIQYGWNSANRLIKVTEGSKVTTYQYDGEDRRIGKVITDGTNTTETQYLIDSERNYDEIIVAKTRTTNGSNVGSWKEELYLYAPDGVGDLLLQSEAGTEHLYQDGKGSTRLVVNNNGTKTTFDYDAFGNPLAGINPQNHIKHRYVGEVLDEETGFYYFRARHYDPKIGRFISRDSFEGVKTTPISLNPYLYAHSDPVNMSDPTGHFGLMDINISQGIQSSLNYMARDYLQTYIWEKVFGSDEVDSKPGLLDHLLYMLLKGIFSDGNVADDSASASNPMLGMAGVLAVGSYGPPQRHHTIPTYLCGPAADDHTYTASISKADHSNLHTMLYAYPFIINKAGKVIQTSFNKRKRIKGIKSQPIPTQRIARKAPGRVLISTGLRGFYKNTKSIYGGNYYDLLTYKDGKYKALGFGMRAPLGALFEMESIRYILPAKQSPLKGKRPGFTTDCAK